MSLYFTTNTLPLNIPLEKKPDKIYQMFDDRLMEVTMGKLSLGRQKLMEFVATL